MILRRGELWAELKRNFRAFAVIHVVMNLLMALVLMPLALMLMKWAVSISGDAALSDQDILFFFISPLGFPVLMALAALFSLLMFLEYAALVLVTEMNRRGESMQLALVALRLLTASPVLFIASIRMLMTLLLWSVPVAGVLGLIYHFFISAYDINYYLVMQPAEWWWALALAGLVLLPYALWLLRLFSGWSYVIPLVMLAGNSAQQALLQSQWTARGRRLSILVTLCSWGLLILILTAAVSLIARFLGYWLISPFAESLDSLVVALTVFLSISFMMSFVLSLVSSGILALLFRRLFDDAGLQATAWRKPVRAGQMDSLRMPAAVLILLLIVVPVTGFFSVRDTLIEVEPDRVPKIVAHRGYSAAAPDNTLAAIEAAIDVGADWVEIDVQESADGAVVVIHDRDLRKVGGSSLVVADSSLQKLQSVDIGSWFNPQFSDQRVPTLEQVLERARDRVGVIIELKYYGRQQQLEQRVIDRVETAGMRDQVMIMSLDLRGIRRLQQLRPGWKVGLLSTVSLGNLAALEVDFLALNGRAATRSLIRSAHGHQRNVLVWTVNDPISMTSMTGRGVDGLITDEPMLAAEVLAQYRELDTPQRLLLQLADLFDQPVLAAER